MKSLRAFLTALAESGVELQVEGDELVYRIPIAAGRADVRRQLAERKYEILAFLRTGIDRSSIQPIRRDQEFIPSFSQQRLWFLDQLEGGGITYNMPSVLRHFQHLGLMSAGVAITPAPEALASPVLASRIDTWGADI